MTNAVIAAKTNFLFDMNNKILDRNKPTSWPETKHYNDMNRSERRKYKRWLEKSKMWDGAEVVERLTREGSLVVSDNKH